MKAIKTFEIGSKPFFSTIDGYVSKDIDKLHIMDTWKYLNTNVLRAKIGEKDNFFFKNMSKDEFIQDALDSKTPMRVGKFLVKDFAEYLGMNIEDLKRCEPLINELDNKHLYEKIIYESYIKNGDWTLTDKQLQKAYNTYKKYRKQ